MNTLGAVFLFVAGFCAACQVQPYIVKNTSRIYGQHGLHVCKNRAFQIKVVPNYWEPRIKIDCDGGTVGLLFPDTSPEDCGGINGIDMDMHDGGMGIKFEEPYAED